MLRVRIFKIGVTSKPLLSVLANCCSTIVSTKPGLEISLNLHSVRNRLLKNASEFLTQYLKFPWFSLTQVHNELKCMWTLVHLRSVGVICGLLETKLGSWACGWNALSRSCWLAMLSIWMGNRLQIDNLMWHAYQCHNMHNWSMFSSKPSKGFGSRDVLGTWK
jgi:hypothetical protein